MASQADWERIEAEYRAGVLSLREIAGLHSISEGAIRKRAKRDGWSRDLSAKIQAKADELVRKDEVRSAVRSGSATTERAIVEASAQTIADIRLAHRGDIRRGRTLALSLLEELEAQTVDRELFEQLGDILRSEDDRGNDKRNDIYNAVITSAGRIDSLKKLGDTLKTLIGLERQAYGMTDDASDDASKAIGAIVRKIVDPHE